MTMWKKYCKEFEALTVIKELKRRHVYFNFLLKGLTLMSFLPIMA